MSGKVILERISKTSWLDFTWQSAAALICPAECVWCERPTAEGTRICEDCLPMFISDYYRCQCCASPLPPVVPNDSCTRCRSEKRRFSSVVTLGPYRGRLREAVILMKKKRYELLRRAVAELIADELWKQFAATSPLLVPVPNHWTRNIFRSFCQATSLAQSIALANDWSMATNLVWRNRRTSKQGMLSWTERTKNVRGAFGIKAGSQIKGRHVIVVDDVLTSGATANEISRLLVSAGASRVSVAVAARGTGAREIVVQSASVPEKELS